MKVEKLNNGQYFVTHENLSLTQTSIPGLKINNCEVYNKDGDYWESISQHSEIFRPLFIALHNYKCENEV